MRAAIGLFSVILFLVALVGLGLGAWLLYRGFEAASLQHEAMALVTTIGAAVTPLLLGTIALGSLAIVLAVERARATQLVAINRIGSDVAYESRRELRPGSSSVER